MKNVLRSIVAGVMCLALVFGQSTDVFAAISDELILSDEEVLIESQETEDTLSVPEFNEGNEDTYILEETQEENTDFDDMGNSVGKESTGDDIASGGNIASGNYWRIDANGKLYTEGETQFGEWWHYKDLIKSAEINVTVVGAYDNMAFLFQDCKNLESVKIKTSSKVFFEDTSGMFIGCESLRQVDLSGFDTHKVTDMSYMFAGCTSLVTLDLKGLNTENVENMGFMFYGCKSLRSVNLHSFNTGKVKKMTWIFRGCESLTSLDLSNFNTSSVEDMSRMFMECGVLESIDLSSFNTSKVKDMSGMFSQCFSLKNINISNFNTSSVTDMSGMFIHCESLNSLNLSNFNTSSVEDMSSMFSGCNSLKSINLSSFNTSSVTNMIYMFSGCNSLESIDLSSFNTSNVTDMSCMFYECSSLESIDLSSFNTSNVTEMDWMFCDCNSLKSINLSSFNTSNVTSMVDMFDRCSSLETLDISTFVFNSKNSPWSLLSTCYSLISIKAPSNLGSSIKLPGSGWKRSDTHEAVTELPKNLTNSVTLYKEEESGGEEKPDSGYSIVLDGNGGLFGTEPTITKVTSKGGQLTSMPRPKLEGKRFVGYYTAATGGSIIPNDNIFTQNTTIYAHWHDYDMTKQVTITPITPVNGAEDVEYVNGDWVDLPIAFETSSPIERFDLSGGSFRIIDVSTGKTVFEAKSERSFKKTDSGTGSRVDFKFMYSGLERGKEYAIEIDEGFLVFEDYELFAYTDKDDWHFKTNTKLVKRFKIRNEFYKEDKAINYDFAYSDDLFASSAYDYNHNRAIWAFGLAMAGFESYRGGEGEHDKHDGNYSEGYLNASEMLYGFGFSEGMPNDDYKKAPERNTFGTYCASKKLTVNKGGVPKDYTLIAVTTRGAGYGHEWYSNAIVGLGAQHKGFKLASDNMLNHIVQYIKDKNITGDIKIIMAGYSRAGAATNLTAARIDEGELSERLSAERISANISNDNVYAYCFEPPAVSKSFQPIDYNNITCIINPADVVPMVPLLGHGWNFGRYGKIYYLPSSNTNSRNYANLNEKFLSNHFEFFQKEFDNRAISLSIGNYKIQKSVAEFLPDFINHVNIALPSVQSFSTYEDSFAKALDGFFTDSEIVDTSSVLTLVNAIPPLLICCATDIAALINDFDLLFQIHEPSVNFTWLTTINGEEDFNTGEWNVIYLNCPINTSVYNSSNELVAQIVNDEPVEIEGSFIASYVDENGQKVFVLPKDDDFRVEIEATDNGMMDYSVAAFSLDEEGYTNKILYQDIEIKKGNRLTGEVQTDGDISLSKGNTDIDATQTFTGSIPEYEVTAEVEGCGSVEGQGFIQTGNYVKLIAVPDLGAEFVGWYDKDDNLVSTEKEYRFRVDEDVEYKAKFKEMDGIIAAPVDPQVYTGYALTPDITLYDGTQQLTQGIDYTVSYKNNKNVFVFDDAAALTAAQKKAAPQAIIKMKGNYSGQQIVYFSIEPLSIEDNTAFEATLKKGKKQTVVFTYNGKALKEKTDYTVDSVTDSSVTITGKGNFTGTQEFTLAVPDGITNVPMSKVMVDTIPAQFYTGTPLTGDTLKAKDGVSDYSIRVSYPKGTELKEDVDYTISEITNPTKVGTATVVIKGLKAGGTAGANSQYSFIGEKRVNVKINPRPIDSATVTGSDGTEALFAIYDKAGAKPEGLAVTVNGITLKEGRDYTVKYSANTQFKGTGNESDKDGMLTVTGKGNYKGSKKAAFKIRRRPFTKEAGITVVAVDKPQDKKPGKYATTVKVFDSEGKLLKSGTDYEKEIVYLAADGAPLDGESFPVEGDIITVRITGKGAYSDDIIETTYKILKAGETTDISKADIKIDPFAYKYGTITLTGDNASHVSATIGKEKKELTFSTDGVNGDFMVLPGSYVNNDKKGTATLTFVGINGCSGCKTVKFKIGTRSLADWWRGLFR